MQALEVLGINMGRRRELGSIASGIIGSFRSRNNDVDGYWGIGKLYLFVDHLQSKCVSIDLCSQRIAPYNPHFDLMTECYSKMFKGLLIKRSIPLEWIRAAYVYVEFEADYEERHHNWRSALGNPCNLVCVVVDDNGKSHVARAYTNCFPHDAKRESRSIR
ncbi:hypothetical protein VFSR5_2757 [Aliivibrio fischeri SR5]|uniref:Uncharacterized protein n=2 Tax=Aliivibrio fischeri TaxID=668 RepID=A0AAV3EMG5_ALIFS|nr:hypothetical protein VFSR5_2757 [Aliivibrio fischeri SR5]